MHIIRLTDEELTRLRERVAPDDTALLAKLAPRLPPSEEMRRQLAERTVTPKPVHVHAVGDDDLEIPGFLRR